MGTKSKYASAPLTASSSEACCQEPPLGCTRILRTPCSLLSSALLKSSPPFPSPVVSSVICPSPFPSPVVSSVIYPQPEKFVSGCARTLRTPCWHMALCGSPLSLLLATSKEPDIPPKMQPGRSQDDTQMVPNGPWKSQKAFPIGCRRCLGRLLGSRTSELKPGTLDPGPWTKTNSYT